ncbi:phosphotransferase family protein [Virgibacillus ndiopensis]|uniref:phosphotransferase family protein n=1 Tax=Virgibacillus ndiopensis TaxID=2004408 RepID=UPI000C074B4F|nr:aminoglycoside phosphotransferase family protein [Virgibacillus ndiopensis]
MKAGWERTYKLITPDKDTVKNMLNPFLKAKQINRIQALSGGLNNSNLKITTDTNEKFVLRIYNKENNISMNIERDILTILEDKIPVPQPLYSDSSCTIIDYPFILLSWVHGNQLSEILNKRNKDVISNAAKEAGDLLAKVHRITFPSSGFFDKHLNIQDFVKLDANKFLMYIEESSIKGRAKTRLGSNLSNRIFHFAKKHAYLIDNLGKQNSLVHGDFNPLNILAKNSHNNINITGLLDWEYAFSGSPLMDIGNMLRYEDVHHTHFLSSFISSYQNSGGTLPDKWLQKAKLLDLIALCSLMDKKECGEVRIRDIKELILNMMEEWEMYDSVQKRFL